MAVNDQLNFQTHQYVSPVSDLQQVLGAGGMFASTLKGLSDNDESQIRDYKNLIDMQRQDAQDQRQQTLFDEGQTTYQQQQNELQGKMNVVQALTKDSSTANKSVLANANYNNLTSGAVAAPTFYQKDGKSSNVDTEDTAGAIIPQNQALKALTGTTDKNGKLIDGTVSTNDMMVPSAIGYGTDVDGKPIVTTTDDQGNTIPLTKLQAYVRNARGARTGTDDAGNKYVYSERVGAWYNQNKDGNLGVLVDPDRQINVKETMQDLPINNDALQKMLINPVEAESKNPMFKESELSIINNLIQDYKDKGEDVPLSIFEAKETAQKSELAAKQANDAKYQTLDDKIQETKEKRDEFIAKSAKDDAAYMLDAAKAKVGTDANGNPLVGAKEDGKTENLAEKAKSDALTDLYTFAKIGDNKSSSIAHNIQATFLKFYDQGYSPFDIKTAMMANITSTGKTDQTTKKGEEKGDLLRDFSTNDMNGYTPMTEAQRNLANGISVNKNTTGAALKAAYAKVDSIARDVASARASQFDNQLARLKQQQDDIYSSSNQTQARQAVQDSNKTYTDMFPGFKNIDQTTRDNQDKTDAATLQNILKSSGSNGGDGNGGGNPPASTGVQIPTNQGDLTTGNSKVDDRFFPKGVDAVAFTNAISTPESLKQTIAFKESGNPDGSLSAKPSYSATNKTSSATGKYQMTMETLHSLGGKFSKITQEQFIANPALQEDAYKANVDQLATNLSSKLPNWNNMSPGAKNVAILRSWNSGAGHPEYATKGEDSKYMSGAYTFLTTRYKQIQDYWAKNQDKLKQQQAMMAQYGKDESNIPSQQANELQTAIANQTTAQYKYDQSKQLDWFGNVGTKVVAAWDSHRADINVNTAKDDELSKDIITHQIPAINDNINNLVKTNTNGINDMKILLQQQALKKLQEKYSDIAD